MNARLILRFVADRLLDRTTYWLALVVGAVINLYGQLLLPWFRGSFDPPTDFLIEFEIRPDITILSVLLGFAFPFCVSIYSAVVARYKNRHLEVISNLREHAPDPMFLVDRNGAPVDAGARTWQFLKDHGIDDARKILGAELWSKIVSGEAMEDRPTVFFQPAQTAYVVCHAPTGNGGINLYLARLPEALAAAVAKWDKAP